MTNSKHTNDTLRFLLPLRGAWCWLLAFIGMFSPSLFASHNMGADISYRCLGNNQYEITATYYRDCRGFVTAPTSLPIAFSSAGCSVTSTSVNAPQVAALSGIEVSPLCAASISQSSCNNTAANALPGVEVYVYRTTITLPQACADWVVSYSDCCRNSTITNLAPNGGSIYVAATINNTNGLCNNSPTFTSRPIPYICANQPYSFNHGAVDADGDSLYYQIINPLESATLPINFGAGLSTGYPINTVPANTFNFSNQTGQMSFTPAGNQVAVLAVMVYEIRNGDTIGRTMRDIQMVVINGCTNGAINNPQNPQVNLGGSFDTTSRSFIVCQGETLYFTISARDPNPTDTLDYDYVNTNLFQVFGAGNFSLFPPTYPIAGRFDTADFIIAVTPPIPGLYQFVIGLTDKACPIPSTPTFGFNVVVPGVEIEARDTVLCPGIAQAIPLRARTVSSALSTVPGTIGWTQISGVTSPLNPLTGGNVTSSIPASTVNGNVIQYEVTYTTIPDPSTGTTCVTRDTVNVNMMTLPLSVIMTVSDTTFCANGTANPLALNTQISGPGVDTVNGIYTWTSIPAGFTGMLSNTNTAAPSGNITGTTPGLDFSYAIQYQYGACVGRDTQAFHFNPGVVVTTPTTISACPGDTVQLRGYLSDTNIVRLPVLCSDYDVSTIPYVTISGTGTSTGATGDDGVSGALNIGFPFVFMCDTFTQFKATTNGYITFDMALVASAPWTPAPIPAAGSPNSYIALAWNDLTVGSANQINYFVTGTAPNRRLVVNYTNVAHLNGAGVPLRGQIILHEGTNYIDLMTTAYTHDGSDALQGIENRTGTIGYAAPGRNGTTWSATNSGVRFQPRIAFSFDPITYAWSPTPGLTASNITNPRLVVQSPGVYTVTVSEGTCAQTGTIQVNVNSALTIPTITCNPSLVTNSATQIGFSWAGSPGAIGWEYSIDSGRTWVTNALADSFAVVSNRLNGSCLQIYVRPLGGASACPRNAAATFTCCTAPCAITINATPSHISCAGRTDGAVQTIATGGTIGAPYTLNLFNATTSVQIGSSVTSNGTATLGSNLPVGVYMVTGRDAFGCTGSSMNVTITEPTVLNAAFVSLTNAACFNTATGSATASASGATAPYTYTWTSTTQTTAMVTGLAAGTYNVTVTDARGCTDTLANIIIRNPFAQAPVASLATTNSTSCPTGNGTAAVQVVQNMTGSPASFGYAWSSGQNGTGVSSVSGLGAGSYRVTITDANGCTVTNSFTLTGATVLINGFSNDNPDCGISNGSVSVSATNGTAPYSYQWSANANGQTTQTINNLGSGTYSVTVTDANGCRANGTVMLDANSVQLVISNREDRVVCFGDATGFIDVTATANGNTSNPITYLWSSGQTTADISGLVAGTYTLTASVQSGTTSCPSTISMVVRQPAAALNATAIITRNLDCSGQPVGALNASAVGGWGANTYVWSNGISSNDLNNLAAGTYTVTTTDAEGCKDTASVVLVQPAIAPLNAYISVTGQTSAVTLQNVTGIVLSGGVTAGSGVTYSWSPSTNVAAPNSLNTTVDALTAGNFVYIIKAQTTDCQTLDTVNLEVIAAALRGMPSAFTPDGDGDNDFFRPVQASNLVVTQFKIFNRWGQLLYDNPQGYLTGWDGTHNGQPQPRDGYIYVFEYRLPTETNVTSLRGEFTLIR